MISTRSKRLVDLAAQSLPIPQLPKYESTKGTTPYERRLYFRNEEFIALRSDSDLSFEIPQDALPKYESTKGTTPYERRVYFENVEFTALRSDSDLSFEIPIQDELVVRNYSDGDHSDPPEEPYMSSGSEYLPPHSPEFASNTDTDPDDDDNKKNERSSESKGKAKKAVAKSTDTDTSDPDDDNKKEQNSKRKGKAKKAVAKTTDTDTSDLDDDNKKERNSERKGKAKKVGKKTKQEMKRRMQGNSQSESGDSECGENSTHTEGDDDEGVCIDSAKNKNGKRIRDKGHACYFCDKILGNLARHFELMHPNELEVAKILALPKKCKPRRDAFGELLKVGDFHHNCNVLATGKGELILVRRPSEKEKKTVSYHDYGPCPECLGFLLKKRLWYHVKYSCKRKGKKMFDESEKGSSYIGQSNALISGIKQGKLSSEFMGNIVSKFRDDEIGKICQNDEMILKFGLFQFEKYGRTQNELIRQSMRQLARLLIELRNIDSQIKNLNDCLRTSEKFDTIVAATKSLCVSEMATTNDRPQFKIPSLALKIGHSLKKCIGIKRGDALRKGDMTESKVCICLRDLMKMEWATRVSSAALSTLHKRKFNTTQLLPLTEDLIKLTKYLDKQMQIYRDKVEHKVTTDNWKKLATCILARIILFNKRRSGEAAKLTLQQYAARPDFTEQCTQEMRNALSDLEKELANRMQIVEVQGKRGRRVPVLLTPEVKRSIDVLIKSRNQIDNIKKENPYIFARFNSLQHLRGHDCLRTVTGEADLKCPNYITGTKLRKYIATVTQLLNLQENETDWLARHLGHDIRVHRDFYRLHESAVEATKVSRLLIAVENGEISKNIGRNLNEIEVKDMPPLVEEDGDDEEEEVEEEEEPASLTDVANHPSSSKIKGSSRIPSLTPPSPTKEPEKKSKKQGNKTGKRVQHKQWQKAETECVYNYFKINIKKEIVPGKEKCEKCIEENPKLKDRTWTHIKFHVKNLITKNRRATKEKEIKRK